MHISGLPAFPDQSHDLHNEDPREGPHNKDVKKIHLADVHPVDDPEKIPDGNYQKDCSNANCSCFHKFSILIADFSGGFI
jgi:hypothetical protein